jgi:hypothetical protein
MWTISQILTMSKTLKSRRHPQNLTFRPLPCLLTLLNTTLVFPERQSPNRHLHNSIWQC